MTPQATVEAAHDLPPHNPSRAFAIAAVAYAALAVALTFPLVLHLSSVVPHDLGDPLLSTAILWWNAHVPWFTERWWNGFAFYPAPGFLALLGSAPGREPDRHAAAVARTAVRSPPTT